MELAQQGDAKAYESVIRDIAPIIESAIRPKINRQEDADDIIQETLVSVHRASHTWQPGRPLKPWIYAIADRRLKDYLRKRYRRGAEVSHEHEDIDRMAAHSGAQDVTPDHELGEYVHEALEELPEKQRIAVTMMKLEGYSAKDVASKLDMSESAVKVMVHRIYKQLADAIRAKQRQGEA